jgi:glucan phosphorylase
VRWRDRLAVGVFDDDPNPHDVPIAGHQNGTVNALRLWAAEASRE